MHQTYPSILLEKTVREISKLPGVGSKTALRYALFLLRQGDQEVMNFVQSIADLKLKIKYCNVCHNISDTDTCSLCADPKRESTSVCVVENIRDVMAIENTGQYRGLYHVLGGIISPIDGIGPQNLAIPELLTRAERGDIHEIILALSSTMEGDTTNFYLYRKLENTPVKRISIIARGIAIGDELEYADEVTLGRSILNRIEYVGR